MKRPIEIVTASVLALLYSIILIFEAILLLYEYIGGHGHIGSEHLKGVGAQGLIFTTSIFIAGAILLFLASYKLYFKAKALLLLIPLVSVFVIGIIGETLDAFGSASISSDITGAIILIMMALPVILIFMPSSRSWIAKHK